MKRKILSTLLTLCMVLTLVPTTAFADEGTGSTPSVSAYATKDQLKGVTFAPDSNGNATNIGKLVFGKKEETLDEEGNPEIYSPAEWYILGEDNKVLVDNTIIFAANPIKINQQFNSSDPSRQYTYNYMAGTGYGDYSGSIEVYRNHYVVSQLRAALNNMVDSSNTTYFTAAEKGLMNTTTVTTNDTRNDKTYTTTDKLYALAADGSDESTIKAGSNNQIALAANSYWNSGNRSFWLRLPYDNSSTSVSGDALQAEPGKKVNHSSVSSSFGVRPASNLNLSNVLFASAATASSSDTVSGTIADGTAMTLRLDGSSKNIGAVAYRTATGDIFATKGSTTGDVALVVQGKEGNKDWYYSKQITGTETEIVNVSDIKSELGLSADIDLLTAKIWLETTDAADGMIYAVDPITSDNLISITPPAPITVDNGTAYENMNLPETVQVVTAENSLTKLPVVWDTATPKEGSYDPDIKTEQTVTLYGSLQLPDAFEHNPDGPAITTITITIKAAPATSDNSNKDNDSKTDTEVNGDVTDVKDSVNTGDNTNLVLWIVLMLLSAMGITGVTVYSRRKRTTK